ncbi:HNH endonuclease signature motif containing protein [Actinomyces ruminicola]|uniref:HNH endonuclease signature motif containing protein n=1 Tax=Actinomyces ruminicola TaxID=332524 RepID=UPI0034E8B0DA
MDHVRPWAEGGSTSLNNLTSLCQAHHRLKHTPGWILTRQDDGALVWTTPTGARYRRGRDGAITLMAHKGRAPPAGRSCRADSGVTGRRRRRRGCGPSAVRPEPC